MTNREKLLKSNIFDVLCDMNKNLLKESPYGVCIMQGLDVDRECEYNCGECIAKWLGEEARP